MSVTQEDKVKVDAIVVGGGPAGLVAAYTMAKAGLEVILIERGEYAGAKNVGGLLYGSVLSQILPDFYQTAPIERSVSKRVIHYLGDDDNFSMSFGSRDWSSPPYNNTFIVHRSQFDRWLARKAEEAGVNLLEATVVDELLYSGEGEAKQVIGVKIRGDELFYADVVVLAEGANALLTKRAKVEMRLAGGSSAQEYGVGVKEIIALARETIDDRFNLTDNEGAALDFFGSPFNGLIGGGFIYTAKDAVHIGCVARSDTLTKAKLNPNDLLDRFKLHPRVKPLIKGGKLLEYSAHLIPEGGFNAIGDIHANGLLIAGDAAGFVNMSIYKEGTNLAMESGRCAGEVVALAKSRGNFTKLTLAEYRRRLEGGMVFKDLKKYKKLPHVFENCPNIFALYPEKMARLMVDFFTVNGEPKSIIQKRAIKNFLTGLPKARFLLDVIRAKTLV